MTPGGSEPSVFSFSIFGLDARHDVVGVKGSAHDDDRQGNVVVVIPAGDAEPRHVADRDLGDILDLDRNAVDLREDDILDVVDVPALGQILVAAAIEQPDAADVHRLLADGDLAAADIDVGIAECADDLRYRDVVGVEFVADRRRRRIAWSCRPMSSPRTTPGTVYSRRVTIQSCTVRRLVRPKCGGPTTW